MNRFANTEFTSLQHGGEKEEPCRTTVTLLDWLNLIVSRTIPERSAISSEGGKYIICRLHLKTQVKRMQAYLEKHHIIMERRVL
jgi:hypothetical protein